MKPSKLIYTVLVLSLLIWTADALIDFVIDGSEEFMNLLILKVPVSSLYFRLFLIGLSAIMAILVYYDFKKMKLLKQLDIQIPEYILDERHEDYKVLRDFFHTVKTQLNNIVGFTSLLREKLSDEDTEVYIEYLESSKKALQDSVEKLLMEYREKQGKNHKIKLPEGELELDWSSKKVLVAEDNETNYSLLKFMLKKTEVELIWVVNGKQAVDLIEEGENLDLILMDILMPELDGMEAARQIRRIRPELPIIAQTAYSFRKDEMVKNLFDDIIFKPVWQYDLLQICSRYL
jgi:CheY-like chemotaxis protein